MIIYSRQYPDLFKDLYKKSFCDWYELKEEEKERIFEDIYEECFSIVANYNQNTFLAIVISDIKKIFRTKDFNLPEIIYNKNNFGEIISNSLNIGLIQEFFVKEEGRFIYEFLSIYGNIIK